MRQPKGFILPPINPKDPAFTGLLHDDANDWASIVEEAFEEAYDIVVALIDASGEEVTPQYFSLVQYTIFRLIACGAWTLLGVLYVLAVPNKPQALLNWKAPATSALVEVNVPTFAVGRGFTGNGTNAYLTNNTPLASIPGYVLNDASMLGWALSDITDTGQPLVGVTSSLNSAVWPRRGQDNSLGAYGNGGLTTSAVTTSRGLSAWTRTDPAAIRVFKNGALINTPVTAASTIGSGSFCVLRSNTSYSAHECAFAAVGASLSPAQQAFVYAIFRDYLLEVGAI